MPDEKMASPNVNEILIDRATFIEEEVKRGYDSVDLLARNGNIVNTPEDPSDYFTHGQNLRLLDFSVGPYADLKNSQIKDLLYIAVVLNEDF